MKIVVDTNILFSFFWENSLTKKLLINSNIELISPEIALKELIKYSQQIIEKTKINKNSFEEKINELKTIIKFIKEKEYSSVIKEAEEISPDKGDSHFFALCIKFNCILWSNDLILQNQKRIKVLTTKDILNLFD